MYCMFSYLLVWATRTCILGGIVWCMGRLMGDADYGECVVKYGCSRRRRVSTNSCDICIKVRKIVCGSVKMLCGVHIGPVFFHGMKLTRVIS